MRTRKNKDVTSELIAETIEQLDGNMTTAAWLDAGFGGEQVKAIFEHTDALGVSAIVSNGRNVRQLAVCPDIAIETVLDSEFEITRKRSNTSGLHASSHDTYYKVRYDPDGIFSTGASFKCSDINNTPAGGLPDGIIFTLVVKDIPMCDYVWAGGVMSVRDEITEEDPERTPPRAGEHDNELRQGFNYSEIIGTHNGATVWSGTMLRGSTTWAAYTVIGSNIVTRAKPALD